MPLPNGFTAIKDATGDRKIVSLVGVVVSIKAPRQCRGSDWVLEFGLQDEFSNALVGGSSSIKCRIFSPLEKLPKISGPGDIAILRKFKLNAWGMHYDCVSDKSIPSGVLVFPASKIPIPELSQAYQTGGQRLPYSATHGTKDPTPQEQMAVIHLKQAASGSQQQVQQHAATVSYKPPAPDKRSLIKDLDFSRFYDVRAQVVNTYYSLNGTFELKVTDYTSNENLFFYADPDKEDAYMVTNRNWTGPYGQLTLNVILYGNNASWVRENISAGDFIFLRNMRTKMSPASKLEGVMHEDRERPDQVDVRRLINQSEIEEINKRREAYEQQRGTQSALQVLQNVPNEQSTKSAVSKKAQKRQRQQKQRDEKEAELKELEEKADKWAAERSGVNTNIRAAFPEVKLSTISEIVYTPHLKTRSKNYNDYTLPFVNAKHRARVRVVDVFPPELEYFAHALNDRKWNKKAKKQDPNNSNTKVRWEWGFILLLEDAYVPPNTVSEKLRVVVGNDVGQGLLNLNAVDLKNNSRVLKELEERLFILWGNLLELKTELRDQGSDLPLPPGDNRLQNKPFDCCIEEYGHEVPITDANPDGYQRMHRLAQTFITT
ncbi:Nn.00g103970.m01.CDS01 [Neocucurbitaria sp. VM-36]